MIPVVSKRHPYTMQAGDLYIGRPSIWGNPFAIGRDGTRTEVVEKYRAYIETHPELLVQLKLREPRRLVCWCKPRACHGDVLAQLLEELA